MTAKTARRIAHALQKLTVAHRLQVEAERELRAAIREMTAKQAAA